MSYRYGYEEIDYVDGTNDWVWNAPQHVLFLRIRELFDDELCALYQQLESLGCWSSTSLINQFNEWQSQWPEELIRLDIYRKYIRTYTESYINGPAYPEFLEERANGRKKYQRAQYERNQEKYMASKFGGTVASADDIILRCSVPNTTLAVAPNFTLNLIPYSYIYLNVKYNTAPPVKVRAVPNQVYTIPYTGELADIIEIYSASCLTSLGDLSPLYLINGTFANATKIRELILGSDIEGYDNTNSMTLGLGSNELLNVLNIQNMSGLTSSLDLSGLKNLEELYATGSNISGIIFADGGNIRIAEIPAIGSLLMKNLNYLTGDGMKADSYDSLTRLVAVNSLLDLVAMIEDSPKLYQVRLTGIDWTLEDTALLERLFDLAGVTNNDANTDQSVLAGNVFVPVIRQQALYEYNEAWPDLTITYNTMIEQFSVMFLNDDGTVLDVQYIDKGSTAVDPLTREENPIATPTKESTVSTDYAFAGWDSTFVPVFSNQVITATYSETVRSYTVQYVSKGTVMQTETAEYGSSVLYTGEIPSYTAEESGYRYYLFTGWDQSGYVNGDKTINAVYDSCEYSDGYFTGKTLPDLRPVEIYAMTMLEQEKKLTLKDNVLFEGDDVSLTLGHDYDYDDIDSVDIVSEKTTFDGSNYIDTGISLFDEDRDFVLAIDYEFAANNEAGAVLMECFQPNGSNGFKLNYNTNVRLTWSTTSQDVASLGNREMLIIRHVKGQNNLMVYSSNLGASEISYAEIERTKTTSGTATLVLGCSKPEEDAYENHAYGDVHWCKLWYTDLGDEACRSLAIWTHEKVTFEISGFKTYYLSDNPSKRCSFSLLAAHLLDRTRIMNTVDTNEGGWAVTSLNAFLNARLYEAIPVEWKQLIKQVQVSSSVGNKSTELSTSDCYVFIPALVEVDPTMTSDPYGSEGSSISYMTTNDSRKRAYDGGDYAEYWLRSPNVSYTRYYYTIGADGVKTGFASPAYEQHGILLELCI